MHRLAHHQRGVEVRHHHVVRGGREQRRAARPGTRVALDCPHEIVLQAAMVDQHALRLPGGPGRVHHVRERVHVRAAVRQRRMALELTAGSRVVEVQSRRVDRGKRGGVLAVAQHIPGPCVTDHIGHSIGRERRVQRDIRGTCLPDTKERHHQVDPAVEADADHGLRSRAQRHQPRGEGVRLVVELGVGQ